MRIRELTTDDLADAIALSRSANWNQTEEDWRRCLRIGKCYGVEVDERIASSIMLASYGHDLAWIGMVLTLPEYRGRGFASALLGTVLDLAGDIRCVKLDATEAGVPVYRKFGFADECVVERWRGPGGLRSGLPPGGEPDPELDRAAFGADRRELLLALADDACCETHGFAFRRPGLAASQFGPCVSRNEDTALGLARWGSAQDGAVYWDLFAGHEAAKRIAHECRFAPARRLMRMSRHGRDVDQNPELVYALAGFEWG